MPNDSMRTNQPVTLPQLETGIVAAFLSQVYGWMTVGLAITATVALLLTNSAFQYWLLMTEWAFPLILILELVVVLALSGLGTRLNVAVSGALFLFYSILNGIFFSALLLIYTGESVALTFGVTAGTFLLMSAYGFVTKSDLTRWRNIALMALVGIILGSLLNLFLRSSGVQWVITFAAIAVFIVLIAYDTQKLKRLAGQAEVEGRMGQYAVLGALSLYLDFINLFIRLLQIFGKRR